MQRLLMNISYYSFLEIEENVSKQNYFIMCLCSQIALSWL